MPVSLSANCPACKSAIHDDDRVCARCGAVLSVWQSVDRTPLVLPGSPALSQDLVRRKISPVRILTASLAGAAVLFGTLYLMTPEDRGDDPALALANRELPASDEAASLPVTPPALPVPPSPALPTVTADTVAMIPATPAPVIASAPSPIVASARVPAAATPPEPAVTPTSPVLRLAPLVSESLRTGELLRLRWTVQDRSTGRDVPGRIEFTSTDPAIAVVDRLTGTVSGRKPGRVRIIADAGPAGETTVNLVVKAPAAAPTLVAAAADPLEVRTEAARSASVVPSAPANAAPLERSPSVPAPVVGAPIATSASTTVREARRDEAPTTTEVRSAVDRLIGELRRGRANNLPLMEFLSDGAGHRVALIAPPATIGATSNVVRVTFELRMTKFDGGGRPLTRIAPVTMDIEKRDAVITASEVAVGTLRKP